MTTVAEPRLRTAAVLPWISTAARAVLGSVFLLAGVLKAADPQASVTAVTAYELLPAAPATVIGWGLPFAEIALGALLLVGLGTRAVAAAAAMLLLVFLAAVASAALRGLSIDCGCFGAGGTVAPDQTAYGADIARNLSLLLLAGWLVARPNSRLSVDGRR